jgi:hypothetical protein
MAFEHDLAAIGDDHSDDHSECCGLSGTVTTEQPDDTLPFNRDIDLVYNGPSGILFNQAFGFKKIHIHEKAPKALEIGGIIAG